jgi:predicted small metal-binding protein
MHTFECKNMGMDCNFKTSGATVEEVKQKAIAHARSVHKDMLAKMPADQLAGLDKMVTSKIT